MKTKFYFITLLLVHVFITTTKAQPSTYSKVFFDAQNLGIHANSLVPTPDKGYIIAGGALYSQAFLLKIDSLGNESWNKSFALNTNNGFTKIVESKDDNYYVVGSAYSATTSMNDVFYAKINPQGDTLWSRSLNYGSFSCEALNAVSTLDSGLVLTGYLAQNLAPYANIIVSKIDKNGALQWSKVLSSGNNSNYGFSIKQTADSGYIVTGYVENFPPYEGSSFLMKMDKQGNVSWAKKYNKGNTMVCAGNDVVITNNGYLNYMNSGAYATILKTDFSGNLIAAKRISNFISQNIMNSVKPKLNKSSDGGYFTVSGDMGFGGITKLDSLLNLQWESSLYFISIDGSEAADKGYFLIGNGPLYGIRLASPSSPQIGLIKADSLGVQATCTYTNLNTINQPDTLIVTTMSIISNASGSSNLVHPLYTSLTLSSDSGCVTFLSAVEENSINTLCSVYPNPSDRKSVV